MKIEQIYTGCLAHGAYYIFSEGEAAIIDPLRESEPYLSRVQADGAKLKYIFETHFHADFVSGHIDLAKKTGAQIVYGPGAKASYAIYAAEDGEIFQIGKIKIKVLHTPGHTLESATYLLIDEQGKDHCIFSGDTLFIGDVGRPDLAVKSDLTREQLGSMLYDSIQNKILPLSNDIIVYPGHGAGSACGKNMSKETVDTLGHQKEVNYALRSGLSREQFIEEVIDGQLPPPQYFFKNAVINKQGYEPIDQVIERGNRALSAQEFASLMSSSDYLVIDTRAGKSFVEAHIPGSVFIGIDGQFANWVGTLITDLNQKILFITEQGREEEVVKRLARVGYDHAVGYLSGGIASWQAAGYGVQSLPSVSPLEFAKLYNQNKLEVLDVRRPSEFETGHLVNAQNLPLDFLNQEMASVPKSEQVYVHCAGGYRSLIFASILESRGYSNLINVEGGYAAIRDAGVPVETASLV
jgi:glyoxylase-like metal-dependent hydrolase (beta-lactamase superfamily II)/rhodanese-related sulfurtransferase